MSVCKSCATTATTHKAWCMRPAPYQPANAHVIRAEYLRMCA